MKDELPLVRGGWKDRNGIYYEDGIYTDRPCSVNIVIKKTSKMDVNSMIFQENISNIMKKG
jgi:hypothetical protein